SSKQPEEQGRAWGHWYQFWAKAGENWERQNPPKQGDEPKASRQRAAHLREGFQEVTFSFFDVRAHEHAFLTRRGLAPAVLYQSAHWPPERGKQSPCRTRRHAPRSAVAEAPIGS